jgi:hypothetical protein
MWSKDAAEELEKWGKDWEASFVTTHWRRHGLNPGQLPDNRTVTFGKEWIAGQTPIKYPLNHITTTGLAATVMEIIRTTSYKDVGLKLARDPWGDDYQGETTGWRDAKLEILICQLLIYFDDFTDHEIQERFHLLLQSMLASDGSIANPVRTQQLERLGCLSLLLVTEKQAKNITRHLWKLFKDSQAPGGHLLLIVGLLMRRANNYQEQLNIIPTRELDFSTQLKIKSWLSSAHFWGQGEEVRGTRHAIFSLVLLLGENDYRNHTGFLRKKLTREIHANKQDLIRDLGTLAQSLREIDSHVLTDTTPSSFNPQEKAEQILLHIINMEKSDDDSNNCKIISSTIIDDILSLAKSFRKDFLIDAGKIAEFLATSVLNEKWKEKVNKKSIKGSTRWIVNGSIVLPDIAVSMKDIYSPEETFIIFPPIARRMVRDYIYNVVHSSRRIDELECDLSCTLKINEDVLLIEMWNYTNDIDLPKKKAAEGIVSAQLIKNPATPAIEEGKTIVKLQLPLIQHLYGSEK